MVFDWTFNVGNIISILFTLIGFGLGAIGLYYGLKGNVDRLAYMLEIFGGRIINIENEVKALREVLIKVSVQDERLSNLDRRLDEFQSAANTHRAWVAERIGKLENHKVRSATN